MNNKFTKLTILAITLLLIITGCSKPKSEDDEVHKTGSFTIKEELKDAELHSGLIQIEDKLYQFPMSLKDFQEIGLERTGKKPSLYDPVQTYTTPAGTLLEVKAFNMTEAEDTLDNLIIYVMTIARPKGGNRTDVMFSQGFSILSEDSVINEVGRLGQFNYPYIKAPVYEDALSDEIFSAAGQSVIMTSDPTTGQLSSIQLTFNHVDDEYRGDYRVHYERAFQTLFHLPARYLISGSYIGGLEILNDNPFLVDIRPDFNVYEELNLLTGEKKEYEGSDGSGSGTGPGLFGEVVEFEEGDADSIVEAQSQTFQMVVPIRDKGEWVNLTAPGEYVYSNNVTVRAQYYATEGRRLEFDINFYSLDLSYKMKARDMAAALERTYALLIESDIELINPLEDKWVQPIEVDN